MNLLELNWIAPSGVELLRWVNEELAGKRAKLEQPTITHEEAQVLRGEIKVLKNILAQPELVAQGVRGVPPERD
jgi:hypothetical protein